MVMAAIAAAALCGACGAIVGPDAPSTGAALFDRVWSDVDLHYSFFGVKQINWDSLRAEYRPEAVTAQSAEEISAILQDLLGELHDAHVLFNGYPVGIVAHVTGPDPTIPYGRYTTFDAGFPSGVSYGTAGATVGYLAIASFEGTNWLADVDSALGALAFAHAIIVDVRNNPGGFLENAIGVASRFADRTTTVALVRYRNGPGHSDFTPPIAQEVVPAGAHRFLGRVYLLTSRSTISAAELFVLSMQALGRTTVVGDTTAGQAGSPLARELQNGWTYQFPESIELTTAGAAFENIGLPPDLYVPNNTDLQHAQRVDVALARAIALASGPP